MAHFVRKKPTPLPAHVTSLTLTGPWPGVRWQQQVEASEGRLFAVPKLLEAALALAPEVIADRRAIHHRPELAYRETETAALVAGRLTQLGLRVRPGVAVTGVVGLIEGASPGKTVLLRADMDALPIQEDSHHEYTSANPGVMHACGHDAHTAILLGVAKLLSQRRRQMVGNVKLMFQPAEEGGAGALRMIEEGVLEAPGVDAAFMLHVSSLHEVGQVATKAGPALAGTNLFTITINGRGGHASTPHVTVDPVVVAAHVVSAVQTIVSREVDPSEPVVITLGSIRAGTAANIIPDQAIIQGTVRAYSDDVMSMLERRLEEMVTGIARTFRANAQIEYFMHYPATVNDPEMAALLARSSRRVLGDNAVLTADPIFAGEDFAFILERVPGAMLHLGVRNPEWADERPPHTARFDLDEGSTPLGVACLTAVALDFLARDSEAQ